MILKPELCPDFMRQRKQADRMVLLDKRIVTASEARRQGALITNDVAAIDPGPARVQSPRQMASSMSRSVVSRLMANDMDVRALRTNDLLRKDEWVQLDSALIQIATVRLRPLELLRTRGLTQTLDGLGVLISQYERLGDMTDAEISMSGIARTQEDSSNFDLVGVPVPVISKDFRINIRRLLASRRNGEGVDVTQIMTATRKVSEMLVYLMFFGYPGRLDGSQLTGLLSHGDRNLLTGSSWSSQDNAYNNIVTGIGTLQGDHFYGPYGLFVNNTQYLSLLTYVTSRDTTFLQRIQAIPNLAFVEPADQLPSGRAVMFQLTKDVMDMAIAQDVTTVEWDEHGGLTAQYKVMAAMTPRPKSDQTAQSGILDISSIN
jgi:uncharacterized linocin/CFP29 family protein